MADLKNPKIIIFKGILFLVLGIFSASLLLCLVPEIRIAVLLAISIWAFCRFYYFAFYVIEKYVDGNFKFAGLVSVAAYLLRRDNSGIPSNKTDD